MARKRNDKIGELQNPLKGKKKRKEKGSGTKKYERNRVKCARYRSRVGKPHREGNKRGKNKTQK